jgi:hypothetical protein
VVGDLVPKALGFAPSTTKIFKYAQNRVPVEIEWQVREDFLFFVLKETLFAQAGLNSWIQLNY